ncbi:nitrate reductase subunit alpha [Salmonella enterica subsp. enterica serovar Muenster]|nr:nitrate reductase subunit alpha [Salmonella enterica subsp. enterica serovar Muenster]
MSKFLDRFRYFKQKGETFADGHGQLLETNRDWEDGYRQRWQHDKIVRSTHGVNCTGSCSWKIYVKNGLVTWETQQTDYPRTRPDMPNHEPRGCPRGASYSWYLYSANRLKYPLMRKRLMKMWREAKKLHRDPVEAWASIIEDADKAKSFKQARGRGGFVRSSWQEVNELIAASNVYTVKTYGPDRVAGFSPIPAMSMVSYASGARYLSLIGGTCLSFYDWYCDLPPASPQTWGEQTDVPESADWYNSSYIIAWGSNVPQTRTPDAHFFTEVRYKGTKTVAVTPDYAEIAKLCDLWLAPKQGTDAAMALAMGHVMLREFHLDNPRQYFTDYVRRYTDMPMLVMLEERDGYYAAGRMLRAADLVDSLGQENNPEWKTVAINSNGEMVAPNGSIGFRWGEKGKWNLEQRDGTTGAETELQLSLLGSQDEIADVGFPYFGGEGSEYFNHVALDNVLLHKLPVKRLQLADGSSALVTTVYDLTMANYGLERGLNDENCAASYDDTKAYTPAWAEQITGVPRAQIIRIAREFADNADKTHGRSMIIVGAGLNHWYHLDMNYRGLINMLVFCGCVGQSGGGWAHYVGQEKLRPQTGWQPLAFALDWQRPARHMNSTSYFYNHSSQWRYETVTAEELLSPMADKSRYSGHLIDFNVRAERMGWLPSAPQLGTNPLYIAREAEKAGMTPVDYTVKSLKEGSIRFAAEQPENGKNHPRNLFIWRSNLLGSSGKGHEYMLKYLLGTEHGIQGLDLGKQGGVKPEEVEWRDNGLDGKLDLVVTLDFRLSSTCLYSDIVLPTATWYEKDDMNTSDMHPFIHPLSAAVDPAWESKSDWEIYKGIAKKFSEVCVGHLGKETDVVTLPIQHDSAAELAQPLDVKDWKKGECDLIPGKTAPHIMTVERDYPATYERFTSIGPLMEKIGNGGKGIAWNTQSEMDLLRKLNYTKADGPAKGQPMLNTAIDAAEMILTLAPETNGQVAVKAWAALSEFTGRDHTHLATNKEEEKIRFRDIQAQPRKIISSPTWSGLEDEHVSYNAGYTNVHELIPWRTLSGRQQLYQDHQWMRDFGESEFEKRAKDQNFENMQKAMYGQFENTFMMYLPRLCEHCLNPACVATCPSGAIYKREEDGIVLIDQDKCRGWRMCITGCPYKKIYFNWKSGKSEKCIFCYPRIEAGQPTVCSETCVGRIRYLGVLLYDADAIESAASTENEKDLYQRQLDVFLDPSDPAVIEQALKDGVPQSVIDAAQQSPVYKMAMDWKLALPLHPEYRTLPMVWYVPPLSPIQSAADAGELGSNGILPDVDSLRIPVQYLANLLTAGDTQPVLLALKRMLAMRHYKRAETVDGKVDTRALEEVGLSEAQAQEMYRYLAIANYEDRFVVPSSHRELARDAFPEKSGCGFTFGDGCHGSDTKFNLFNSRRIDAVDVTSKTEPHA